MNKEKIQFAGIVLLIVVFLGFLFMGCTQSVCETQEESDAREAARNLNIVVIDSCEYIFLFNDYKSITHKGNCKFCAERRRKEIQEELTKFNNK